MTEGEAMAYARNLIDEAVEQQLDMSHDQMVREGFSEELITEGMQKLYRTFDVLRDLALVNCAAIAAKLRKDDATIH